MFGNKNCEPVRWSGTIASIALFGQKKNYWSQNYFGWSNKISSPERNLVQESLLLVFRNWGEVPAKRKTDPIRLWFNVIHYTKRILKMEERGREEE